VHPVAVLLPPYHDLPKRPARLVVSPFGVQKLGGFSGEELTLWTIQSADAYRALQRDGVLRARPELRDADFIQAYTWIEGVAAEVLPTSAPALLWFWAQTTRRQIRLMGAPYAKGEVLLTVRIESSRVLVSHFDEWHSCLNNSPVVLAHPGEDDDAWWARAEPIIDVFRDARAADGTHPVEVRRQMEDTWQGIFDRTLWKPSDHLQAVAHEIRAEQVSRAVRIW
jgi:hypothetical protein